VISTVKTRLSGRFLALLLLGLSPTALLAAETVDFTVAGGDEGLETALKSASLLNAATADSGTTPADILAAALADYARLVDTLYANGYYGGVVNIRVNGQEAATIPVFAAPAQITALSVKVDPGPLFRFGEARIAPLAPGTALPAGFGPGAVAESGAVQAAVEAAVGAWRSAGHAKTGLSAQSVSANHAARTLSARIELAPGPLVYFGKAVLTGESGVRAARILRIAGLPEGEVFSPETLSQVAKRLRRSGAFSSVSVRESEVLGPDDSMDILLSLADAKPRRIGFGAEIASLEGLTLSGYWQHRNLFGGGEQFRVDAEISGINPESNGTDYRLGLRLAQPATFGPDTSGFAFANGEILNEPAFYEKKAEIGIGLTRNFSDSLSGEIALGLSYAETEDDLGSRTFTLLTLPVSATWDRRDDPLDAKSGFYLQAEATPYMELRDATFGARLYADGRVYQALGEAGRFALAGRVQLGTAFDGGGNQTPPSYLFFSGGGNTVRGQPYQSLDVDVGGGNTTGGHSFLGLSGELRANINDSFGLVGFADAGFISAESLFAGEGGWQAGAGLGLRYFTPIGPIRLDVALPVAGDTGAGMQLYLGIGQAF